MFVFGMFNFSMTTLSLAQMHIFYGIDWNLQISRWKSDQSKYPSVCNGSIKNMWAIAYKTWSWRTKLTV